MDLVLFTNKNKTPITLQTEATECGLACLSMISSFHGHKTNLIELRQKYSISSQGVTLKMLIEVAGGLNLSARALQLELEDTKQLQLPCILHWDMNHFVVLTSVSDKKYTIHDPAIGKRVLNQKEFAKHFTGIALELSPTDDFEQKEIKATLKLSYFWSKITGLKRSLIQIFILSILLQLFSLASPFFMQTVVDDVLLSKDVNLLIVLSIGFCMLMLIEMTTSTLRSLFMMNMSYKFSLQMQANLFRHLIRLPMDYFKKRHMGDVVSRFGSIDAIEDILTTGLIAAILDGLMAVLTLTLMMIYSVKLGVVVIGFVVLYALVRISSYHTFKVLNEEALVVDAKVDTAFMETVRAIQSIKIFQKESRRQNYWKNNLVESMNLGIRVEKLSLGYSVINGLLFGVENIVVIYLAAMSVMGDLMSLGMLYAFMSYKQQFVGRMNSLIDQVISYKMLSIHLDRLSDITLTKTENTGSTALISRNVEVRGELTLIDVSYRYSPSSAWVFENINLTIRAGESIAIIGASGCGKSTLIKVMMGLFQAEKGKILIDETDVKQFPQYRSYICGVMQDDELLTGSIADNIAFSGDEIDVGKVEHYAKMAAIHDDIMAMPMKYNTLIGDMGASLSGGQKQRVILARALYREPKILFMDEATSHLDLNNESIVSENIKNLNISRIIVAHRKETIASADRVVDLIDINLAT